ncbi:Eukaryotic translation initiation factor 3 subunit I isoform 4 [Schistosoma japonicum]|uniref:Serine-threonine kinase receptor-associated protein n=1 Tax=Schistosoma japonicum TaxID=6182 RepID=A0A4Z2D0I8_SCHJA|nr:Eukaryotic translation initiation factor 3 subunit I isoform 4 [Schistosoma japonicum]
MGRPDRFTGQCTGTYTTNNPVRTCGISFCGNLIFVTTDDTGKKDCEIIALDKRDSSHMSQKSSIFKITSNKSKVTGAIWGPVNRTIICGHESGALTMIDVSSGEYLKQITPHKGPVTDMQMHLTLPMFITGSKDHNAKLFDAYDMKCIRTYTTERPINSAAISPDKDHVLLGGGQEAHEVTTTAVGQGKFDVRFYHLIYQEEFGRVKGHFGPVNSVAFASDGSGFATGGEEGYVRLHTFDSDYADLDQRLF